MAASQADRARPERDPREIKAAFQDAWAISDSKAAFEHALKERGYWLCRGDKRGFVALDVHGEPHSIAKRVGVKTRAVRERLGDETALPSAADTKREIAKAMQDKMEEFQREVADKEEREKAEAQRKREFLRTRQEQERSALRTRQSTRQQTEDQERQARLRRGLLGFWDRLTGERKRAMELNAQELKAAWQRDKAERENLTVTQIANRRDIVKERVDLREKNKAVTRSLTDDAKVFQKMETDAETERAARREAFKERRRTEDRPRRRSRSRDGPEI